MSDRNPFWYPVGVILLTALAISGARWLGWMEWQELAAFDRLVRANRRPPSDNVVVVGFTDTDIAKYGWPIPNEIMGEVIDRIAAQEPAAIGLDVYRELPEVFARTPQLIGINLVGSGLPGIKPPARFAASNIKPDSDVKVRRAFFFQGSIAGLGPAVALEYLESYDLAPRQAPQNNLRLGNAVFDIVTPRFGAYAPADERGDIFMLSWIPYRHEVSFEDVLEGRIESDLFNQRAVLVGSIATSAGDVFPTALSAPQFQPERRHGVQIQAHAAAEIIEAALGDRSPIWTLPEWAEIAYIFLWTSATVAPSWLLRRHRLFVGYGVAIAAGVSGAGVAIAFAAFASNGLWLPVVPVAFSAVVGAIAIVLTAQIVELQSLVRSRTSELEQSNQALARRTKELEQRTEELSEANRDLAAAQEQLIADEKLKVMGAMQAGLSHSIGNRIQNIYRLLEMVKFPLQDLKEREDLPPDILEELGQLEEDVDETFGEVKLISRARKFFLSSFEIGDGDTIDPNSLMQFCVESTRKSLAEDGLALSTDLAPNLSEYRAVPFQFYHVIIGLIHNARDAVLNQRERNPQFQPAIAVSTRDLGDRIAVTVEDNGIGIEPAIVERLFEFGFSTKPSGHGIGLHVSKLIATKYNGEIVVESQPGEGARFIVSLPKAIANET